ncbi:sigma-54-dependent Fis family transcriptional regulator [Alteribacillus sp. YIM 98480]|uniref:sigma-54-dependent Fis family transcriptional regulator n=1 Tax=Alteribacillus sp. YIM 98480 TaxID=2606599 RepID=UPI001E2959E5|nr:sigma-54-dependent Fis family transcriptional regulator [Alteribacillus sp. YIM 98480]
MTLNNILSEWKNFNNGKDEVLENVRNDVAQSWRRSKKAKVDPFKKFKPVDEETLIKSKSESELLIKVVLEEIKAIEQVIQTSSFICVLTNKEGIVIQIKGSKETLKKAEKQGLVNGANRSEAFAGTNAIGLALFKNKPVQIIGAEHFNANFHEWTCSAVPIHHPNGEILGVLNLSGHYSNVHHHTLGLVETLVFNIEKALEHELKNNKSSFEFDRVRDNLYFSFENILYSSSKMKEIVQLAKQVSNTDSRVLVQGESGTGKELIVQAIHNSSKRKNKPFVAINCGAVPTDLMESELFGYSEGAFTGAKKGGKAGKFELADGGTLFLDEVNSMPNEMQVKLLRVLQENEVIRVGGNKTIPLNLRVIAATNSPLDKLIENGEFRQDLFYRLGVVTIKMPPLRERTEDIPLLFSQLLKKVEQKIGIKTNGYSEELISALQSYKWPGNIRELENYIESAVIYSQGKKLSINHFPEKILNDVIVEETAELKSLNQIEKQSIRKTLLLFGGNISKSSKALGITRNTLYNKIKQYNIDFVNDKQNRHLS